MMRGEGIHRSKRPRFGDDSIYRLSCGVPTPPRKKRSPLADKQPLQREPYQSLIRALKKQADELDLSVRGLAERLGRPKTTVHKTLSGQRRIDPIEFLEWCEALELDDPVAVINKVRRKR